MEVVALLHPAESQRLLLVISRVSCLQGAAAYKAKVDFPEDRELLARTVIVGEMNPAVNLEQVSILYISCLAPCSHLLSGRSKACCLPFWDIGA